MTERQSETAAVIALVQETVDRQAEWNETTSKLQGEVIALRLAVSAILQSLPKETTGGVIENLRASLELLSTFDDPQTTIDAATVRLTDLLDCAAIHRSVQ